VIKALALGPSSRGENGLSAFRAPSHPALLHSLRDKGLARGLHGSGADRQVALAQLGVAHSFAIAPKVAHRLANSRPPREFSLEVVEGANDPVDSADIFEENAALWTVT
jgi:hypothetical protein